MRTFLLAIFISVTVFGCLPIKKGMSSHEQYLVKIESFLNENISVDTSFHAKLFSHTSDGTLIGYSIYDLTDTTNIDNKMPDNNGPKINITQGHFYHVSPISYSESFSSIFYLQKDDFKIFRFVNCPNKGDKIDDVLKFASRVAEHNKTNDLITNIRNYRKHGHYTYDDYGAELDCNIIKK